MANRFIFPFLVLLISSALSNAQETSVSPYSVFGIGDLQLGESGRTAGMASTGIGLSGGKFLNTSNPASLASLDSITFLFDISGSARGSNFTSGNIKQKAFGANFTKLTLGTRIAPFWAAALSLQPYSIVSYKVQKEGFIEGTTNKISTLFEGSGGITRLSFINSIKLSRNFSIGADVMLLFGNIDRRTTQSDLVISETSKSVTASFNAGMQYLGHLNDNLLLGAGVVYGHGGNFNFTDITNIMDGSGNLMSDPINSSSDLSLAKMYGAGLSLVGPRFIINTDYRFQPWSVLHDEVANVSFTDSHKFDAGFAFTPAKGAVKSYFELIQYQAGFSVSNSYLTINTLNPTNFEIMVGAGFPFQGGSQMNLALGWGKRGSLDRGLIREDYFRLTISLSICENWFMKRLYN